MKIALIKSVKMCIILYHKTNKQNIQQTHPEVNWENVWLYSKVLELICDFFFLLRGLGDKTKLKVTAMLWTKNINDNLLF